MNIAKERAGDELDGAAAVDIIATLHEKLLERLNTRTIREHIHFEDFTAISLGTKVHVGVKFRTAEGPAEIAFEMPWNTYALLRRKLRYIKSPGRRLRGVRAQSKTAIPSRKRGR